MKGFPLLSLLLLCSSSHDVVTFADAATQNYAPAALQSGPDLAGSSFAASATYDSVNHAVVITGSTYGRFFEQNSNAVTDIPRATSSCFLTTVQLPSEIDDKMHWTVLQTLGSTEDKASEACAASIFHERHDKLIVTGHSERGGFAEDLYDPTREIDAAQYGLMLEFNVGADVREPFELAGGRSLQFLRVTYPMALASGSSNDDYIYVASQETNNVMRNDEAAVSETHTGESVVFSKTEEVDPMRYFMYGNKYRLSIERYRMYDRVPSEKLEQSFEQEWKTLVATDENAGVHVAGIAEIGNVVVVVGTTDGTGTSFGGNDLAVGEGSMDGFVTKFSVEEGEVVDVSGTTNRATDRIQSIDGRDDWIAGMCYDPNDQEHIYIVGATEGSLDAAGPSASDSVEAYAMKLHLATLETIWTTQMGAVPIEGVRTQVRGVSCAISPQGESIWLGGVVQNGAVLPDSGTIESYGGNDIFVAKLFTEDGTKEFVRQIGSEEDDSMAMRGGVVVDRQGNCVVVGSTYGSFYRERPTSELEDEKWISDVFVATISGDNGSIAFPVSHPEFKGSTNSNNGNSVNAAAPADRGSDDGGIGAGVIAFLAILIVGVLASAYFVKNKSKINRDVTTNRSQIIQFLNEFDVEDVDLKHSATGGWHCSYSNDLANGRNRRAERGASSSGLGSVVSTSLLKSDPLMAPLTNSSLLRDSLFMDDEDASEGGAGSRRGGRFSETRSSRKEGYDGLIDAYNACWGERRIDDGDGDGEPSAWGKEIL